MNRHDFQQHYFQANNLRDIHGDAMPFLASDLMLCVYLVLTIVFCVVTA